MDDKIFDQIHEVDLKKTMETSYIGDTMGKYHPHGDTSIYGSLVNMAQEWNMRYPMVDGHGNFGSVDGDSPAAMRYTEARLSKISMEMLADINKNTVDFVPNFDETEKEPSVLPARIPNLLVNGTTGIAVGMATNMPPHNLREVIGACVRMIDDKIEGKDTTIDDLMTIVKGPDFPTGAVILGRKGIEDAYRTGRGKIIVRAVARIETKPSGKSEILVTELPYLVNKARLIESIADLVRNKKIDGITALGDHSSREGMEICIEIRRDANANVILNQLYKHTQLQDTFGVINLALVNGEPKVMNIRDILVNYLMHQEEVVTRRTRYDLNKAEERAHILEGLLIALDNIDEVIAIIRGSENVQTAKAELMKRFELSDAQSQAIVDMRLRALTGLERGKIEAEYKSLLETIDRLKAILADKNLLLGVIRKELLEISDKYGDERRTKFEFDESEISIEDMIPDEPTVITATQMGYIKRMTVENFRNQNRGGKGIKGMQTVENDSVADVMMTTNHQQMLFFTNKGRVYSMKAYQIPEASRTARGTALVNLLMLQPNEYVTTVIPLRDWNLNDSTKYLLMATSQGMVKRTSLSAFAKVRKSGIVAMTLREDDELIEVLYTERDEDIFLVTAEGMSIHFNEKDVRPTGRTSMGVCGIKLAEGDRVVAMQLAIQGNEMLVISENGMGKRTDKKEFNIQGRGGKGVKCYKVTEKTGRVVGAKMVTDENQILLITTEGIMIRTSVSSISVLGRITSGVKVMDLNEGVSVASFTKVHVDAVEKDEEAGLKEDPFNEENESDGTGFDEYGEVDSEKGESEITESEEDES